MKVIVFVYVALVFVAMTSCKNSKQNDAAVPTMNADCVSNPNTCNSGLYQQTPGFNSYNYNNNPYGGGYYGSGYNYNYYGGYNSGYTNPFSYSNSSANLCNCSYGSVPTYNNYAGLGCVQSNMLNNSGYIGVYAYFGWGPNNSQWVNIPQISNNVGYTNSNSSCYNGVVQSCLIDQPNSCSNGYTCRTSSAGSRLGLCVSNNSNSSGQVFR